MNKLLFSCFLVMVSLASFGQHHYGEISQNMRDSLNNEVFRILRLSDFERPRHVKAFDVFYMVYEGFTTKSAFYHGNFTKFMYRDYSNLSKNQVKIHADVYLCDVKGDAFAVFNGYQLYYSRERYLTREMIRLGMKQVYKLINVCGIMSPYFGIGTDGEAYIILSLEEKTFRVQDCPDELWNDKFLEKLELSIPLEQLRIKMKIDSSVSDWRYRP